MAEARTFTDVPATGLISLRDKWFRHLRLYCPPGRYHEAAALVAAGLSKTRGRVRVITDAA
jgi:hypothetical protein